MSSDFSYQCTCPQLKRIQYKYACRQGGRYLIYAVYSLIILLSWNTNAGSLAVLSLPNLNFLRTTTWRYSSYCSKNRSNRHTCINYIDRTREAIIRAFLKEDPCKSTWARVPTQVDRPFWRGLTFDPPIKPIHSSVSPLSNTFQAVVPVTVQFIVQAWPLSQTTGL